MLPRHEKTTRHVSKGSSHKVFPDHAGDGRCCASSEHSTTILPGIEYSLTLLTDACNPPPPGPVLPILGPSTEALESPNVPEAARKRVAAAAVISSAATCERCRFDETRSRQGDADFRATSGGFEDATA